MSGCELDMDEQIDRPRHKKLNSPTVNHAEIEALITGLQLAWERRYQKISVETDSQLLYKMVAEDLDGGDDHLMKSSVLICKELLSKPWEISFNWIKRSSNLCADRLSRVDSVDLGMVVFRE